MTNFLVLQLMKAAYSMFTWQEKKDSSEIQPVPGAAPQSFNLFMYVNVVVSLL